MNIRVSIALALAAALIVAAVLVVIRAGRAAAPAPQHGDFGTRFQPKMPEQSAAKGGDERERLAGIGGIKQLKPVPLDRQ